MMKISITQILLIIMVSLSLISCGEKEDTSKKDTPKEVTITTTNNSSENTAPKLINDESFVAGKDYDVLPKAYATDNSEQVVVYEFFGYTCPHCFHFEPFIDKWLENKPDYVKLVRVPLNFHQSWAIYQQAYLTAEVMGVAEQAHSKLFKALHEDNKRFNSIDELAQWYADEVGINKDEFLSTADSFILDSKLTKADGMGFKMQITGTPTLVVNGKYRPAKDIANKDEVMEIVNFLINKEAKEMGLIK